jgi:hypothetical protein
LTVEDIREELQREKIESRKEHLPPRAPRDKPVISDVTENSLKLAWGDGEIPVYAVQTEIHYTVERRCPPSKNWIEVASDLKETTWFMKDYRPEKDYMFRIRATNEYGISDPSMSATLFATPGENLRPFVFKK